MAEFISHRGYNENKLDGFKAAIKDGYTILEVDIRLRNNKPVLLHDNIDCSDCTELVELLKLAEDKNIQLFLEFKELKAINPSLELITQYNVDVVLISFSVEHLIHLNSLSNYPLGLISNENFSLQEAPAIDYLVIHHLHIDKCIEDILCAAWGISHKNPFDKNESSGDRFNKIKHQVDYLIIDRY